MPIFLDPYLKMRKDGNRVIIYPITDSDFDRSFDFSWRIIDPRAAIIISLFDGVQTTDDVIGAWTSLNGFSGEQGRSEVERTLRDYKYMLLEQESVPVGFTPLNPETLVCDMANLDYSVNRVCIPFSVLYLPTLRCGHNCRYCYADITKAADPNELTFSELENIVNQAVSFQFSDFNLSGGDPFLRKDVFEIIEMLFSRGFRQDVPTKSPLTDAQIKRLKDMGVTRVQISLDSPFSSEIVEYLTGRNDYFPEIMRTLMALGEAGFKVGITSVITVQTIDSVLAMADFYGKLGFIKRVSFSQVGGSIYRDFPELYPPPEKYEELEKEIERVKPHYPHMYIRYSYVKDSFFMDREERGDHFQKRPTCSGGKFAFVLLPDGRVTLCEELYYHPDFIVGDLKKQTIMEMWNSPEILRVVEPNQDEFTGTVCFDCDTFYECHTGKGRCWKRVLKAFQDKPNGAHWPDPLCPQAPQVAERMS